MRSTKRCDQILQLIDAGLAGVFSTTGDAHAQGAPLRPWHPTAAEVDAIVAEMRPLIAQMAAAERRRIEAARDRLVLPAA